MGGGGTVPILQGGLPERKRREVPGPYEAKTGDLTGEASEKWLAGRTGRMPVG